MSRRDALKVGLAGVGTAAGLFAAASGAEAGSRSALVVRRAQDRFHTDAGWLDSRHTFSFGPHHHPDHMGFRALRVINDDRVAAGQGFGTHPHRDMEIVSYVVSGALEHRDSMGNGSVIRPGDVQRMSAGTGVRHSEFNPSATEPVRFLQIWLLPERPGLAPGYEQKTFAPGSGLQLIASPDGRAGSVTVHQDVNLYSAHLRAGGRAAHEVRPGRHAWVQVVRGEVRANGETLEAGDGARTSEAGALDLVAASDAELLVFDLA